jgi:3-oxoadipate enol-lactonase
VPYIDIDDTTLFYRERGSGPMVLFLHAFMLDHSMWLDQFAPLSDERRCVIFDQRGFGRSYPIADEFLDPGKYADDAARLIKALGATSADIVGFSMGGTIALHLWKRHPEVVRSISVLSTGLPGGTPPPTMTPPPASGRGSENYLEDNAHKAVLQGKDVLFRQFDYHYGKDPTLVSKARYRSMFEGTRYEMMVASFRTLKAAPPLGIQLSDIDVPVHVLYGAEEGMLPAPDRRAEIASQLRQGRITLVPKAGRFMSWENGSGTADALREFWRQNAKPRVAAAAAR